VKHLTPGKTHHLSGLLPFNRTHIPGPGIVTINRVSHHGMAAPSEMHPYLVGTTGMQGNLATLDKPKIFNDLVPR
jgi:hypothetical protein